MKREIARYVSECDICQRVKASHLKTAGVLQPLPIPSWKWEDISMDIIVGLPNTSQRHDLMKTFQTLCRTMGQLNEVKQKIHQYKEPLHGVAQRNYRKR
jgi:hypothetical protein